MDTDQRLNEARAEFEAWVRKENQDLSLSTWLFPNDARQPYRDARTNLAFAAWLAGRASKGEEQ